MMCWSLAQDKHTEVRYLRSVSFQSCGCTDRAAKRPTHLVCSFAKVQPGHHCHRHQGDRLGVPQIKRQLFGTLNGVNAYLVEKFLPLVLTSS